jgi:hypothetical protein
VIDALKRAARVHNLTFNPTRIMTDFEKAAMNAFKRHFPQAQIKGCLFHWAQALLKNFKLHLTPTIAATQMDWFRKFCAMALIPISKISDYFDGLLEEIPEEYAAKYRKFTDYFVNNYFEGSFPQEIWNHFDSVGVPRTNNNLEGYNNKMKKFVQVAHPDIFRSILVFKSEEVDATARYTRSNLVPPEKPPARRKKYILNGDLYRAFREMYLKHQITLKTFIEKIMEQFDYEKDKRLAEEDLEDDEDDDDSSDEE